LGSGLEPQPILIKSWYLRYNWMDARLSILAWFQTLCAFVLTKSMFVLGSMLLGSFQCFLLFLVFFIFFLFLKCFVQVFYLFSVWFCFWVVFWSNQGLWFSLWSNQIFRVNLGQNLRSCLLCHVFVKRSFDLRVCLANTP
jgi:hypothetical protein